MTLVALKPGDPATIGPYSLRGRLGSGGMGVVYLGFDDAGSPVALKTVHQGVGPEVRRRLEREAQLLQAVDSDRVARFVAADIDADQPWIAMDYIAGPSLAEVTVPLSPAALRQLADGLAAALQRLHAVGLTHRDLKPGNVILTFDGPVLVDLGIAQHSELTSLTTEGTTIGTPTWMAPEQLAGAAVGPATDVWGWASVVYYAATGRPPFGEGAIPALAYRIQHSEPDVGSIPAWLQGSITVALAKDPAKRPSAAGLARHADAPEPTVSVATVQRNEMDTVISTASSTAVSGTTHRSRRLSTIVSACAVVLILGGGGAIYAATSGEGSHRTAASSPALPTAKPSNTSVRASKTSASASSPLSGVPITLGLLRTLGDCGANCVITGKVKFEDPVAGPSTLITTLDHPGGTTNGAAHIVIVDASGKKEWDDNIGTMYTLTPAPVPTDATGHIFLNYNPGRLNGVIVLTSIGNGVDDFGSLPTAADPEGRFYGATATDTNRDGAFEIDLAANNCDPDCADGTYVHTVYRWSGTAYVAGTTPGSSTPSKQPQIAKLDCKVLSFGADDLRFEVSPGPGTYGHARVTLIEKGRGIAFPEKPTVTVYPYGSESNFHPVPEADTGASAEPDTCTASPVS